MSSATIDVNRLSDAALLKHLQRIGGELRECADDDPARITLVVLADELLDELYRRRAPRAPAS